MRELKAGERGNAAIYITRGKALEKLQLSLPEFRRLCILKGIYPREPKKKVHGPTKTYYLTKDIKFLAHEPLLAKSRELRAYRRKIKKARAKRDKGQLKLLLRNKPRYSLDHIVRERYPTFPDALRDLDDALTMVHLFARLPSDGYIRPFRTKSSERLAREFQHYVSLTGCLEKVFVSIKGFYYSAKIQGERIIWAEPHRFTQELPSNVDYRVMLTFLEFYECLLGFVNYRLYTSAGYNYPPHLDLVSLAQGSHISALKTSAREPVEEKATSTSTEIKGRVDPQHIDAVQARVAKIVAREGSLPEDNAPEARDQDGNRAENDKEDDLDVAMATGESKGAETKESHRRCFSGMKAFLGRETPIAALEFVLRSFGAEVGWEGDGSPFAGDATGITHWIIDRPSIPGVRRLNVEYVQPQWVFDCANNAQKLPVALYGVGQKLPPHLSPFVNDEAEGYTPKYRTYIERLRAGDPDLFKESALGVADSDVEDIGESGDEDLGEDEDGEREYSERNESKMLSADEEDEEEDEPDIEGEKVTSAKDKEELAKLMMTKKKRNLYNRIMHSKRKRSDEVDRLVRRREELEAKSNGSNKKSRKHEKPSSYMES